MQKTLITGTNTTMNTVLWLTVLGLIITFFILINWYRKYNKIVIVKKLLNGRKRIIVDKVRYLKDREGVEWYKFFKLGKKVKIPPHESIEITEKGKEFLECYLLETGEISWARDKNNNIDSIEPFTTEDRQVLQYQFWKAHLEGGINWKELIIPIFGIIALVIITVSLMIFYKDMGKPLLEMADKVNQNAQLNYQILTKMQEIISQLNGTQVIQAQNNIPVVIPN